MGIKGFRQDSALISDPLYSGGKAAPYRWCLGCLLRFINRRHESWKPFSKKENQNTDLALILFWVSVVIDVTRGVSCCASAAGPSHPPLWRGGGHAAWRFLLFIEQLSQQTPLRWRVNTCEVWRTTRPEHAFITSHSAGRSNPVPLDVTAINLRD